MNNKLKKLLGDTALFTIGNFASKVLIFLLVPIYTSILSTEDYGIADLIITSVNLLQPVLTVSICDATLRFALDKKSNTREVLSNSLLLTFSAMIVMLAAFPLSQVLPIQFKDNYFLMFGCFSASALQACFANYVKGCNKTKIFAIQGVFNTIVLITCNIVFLVFLKWGLKGYLLSIIISQFASVLLMIIASHCISDIIKPKYNGRLMGEMLKYSSPMVITSIAWWVNVSADKYMLLGILGASANGLYAVAHKIPTIFTTFSGLFSQAWRISAISSYDDCDKEEANRFYSQVHDIYAIVSVLCCMGITLVVQLIARILFKTDYYEAWILVPPLLIASVFEALSGFMASIYAAYKKTNLLCISTSIGALFNILLNYLFILKVGIIGAPIATFMSFTVVWIIRGIGLRKFLGLNLGNLKLNITLFIMILSGLYFAFDEKFKYAIYLLSLAIVIIVNFATLKKLLNQVLNTKKEGVTHD